MYATPPTRLDIKTNDARRTMGQHVYRRSIPAEFLVRGLIREPISPASIAEGESTTDLRLPRKGEATKEQIDLISPLHLCEGGVAYPPVYQMLGTKDHLFDLHHVREFVFEMEEKGRDCVAIEVEVSLFPAK